MSVKKIFLVLAGLWTVCIATFTTGCASGGYNLTRKYAGFVNKQHIIIRIILYLLTSVVFAVTMIIDLVVFNTMDFWEGRVSQGTYQFNQDEKTYFVEHKLNESGNDATRSSGTNFLRESKITIISNNPSHYETGPQKAKVVILKETVDRKIEVIVDGKLYAQVRDLYKLPFISYFSPTGALKNDQPLKLNSPHFIAQSTVLE